MQLLNEQPGQLGMHTLLCQEATVNMNYNDNNSQVCQPILGTYEACTILVLNAHM